MQMELLAQASTYWKPICGTVTALVLAAALLLPRRKQVNLRGAHVLVTGGSSGIGFSVAQQLLAEGSRITLVARNKERLERATSSLRENAKDDDVAVQWIACDCSNASAIDVAISDAESTQGPVDVLIGCAGGAHGGRFEELSGEQLENGVRANYFTQVHPAHGAFKRMVERGSGHICLVGSMASLLGVYGYTPYAPAKFAVRGLAEVLYYEGVHRGVGITLVLPPDTDTPGYLEELKIMPPETLAISQGAGVFSAEAVARKIIAGVKRARFRVTVGFDGAMLGMVTAGMSPEVSMLEVVCMPILRIASAFYVHSWRSLIRKVHDERMHRLNN